MSLNHYFKPNINLRTLLNNKEYNNSSKENILKILTNNNSYNLTKFHTIDNTNIRHPKLSKEKKDDFIIKNLKFYNNINTENNNNNISLLNSSKSNSTILKNKSTITTSTNIFKKAIFTNFSQINKKKYNKNDYIKLNSLFSLPPIDKKFNRYNSIKTIYEKNKSHNNEIINNNKSRLMLNKYSNKYDNLWSFMKLKYYEDVNEKFEKKLRDDSFIDRGVKDKIIKMGKVGIFWRNVFEYCIPHLLEEKLKKMKKIKKNSNRYNQNGDILHNSNTKFDKKFLYTNMFNIQKIHNKNKINSLNKCAYN